MRRDVGLSLRVVFEAGELPQMEEPEGRRGHGRPRYPPKAMLNIRLIPLRVASEREPALKLKTIPSLAENCGEKNLDQSTINRFKHESIIHEVPFSGLKSRKHLLHRNLFLLIHIIAFIPTTRAGKVL